MFFLYLIYTKKYLWVSNFISAYFFSYYIPSWIIASTTSTTSATATNPKATAAITAATTNPPTAINSTATTTTTSPNCYNSTYCSWRWWWSICLCQSTSYTRKCSNGMYFKSCIDPTIHKLITRTRKLFVFVLVKSGAAAQAAMALQNPQRLPRAIIQPSIVGVQPTQVIHLQVIKFRIDF